MDINKIKVNGELFNISTFHIGPVEPIGVERAAVWIKPIVKTSLQGPTQYYDNELGSSMYSTFDSELGQLTWQQGYPTTTPVACLQTVVNSMGSSADTYAPFKLINEHTYKTKFEFSSTLYAGMTYGVIYLNTDKNRISSQEYTIEDVTIKSYDVNLEIPEGAVYAVPYINLNGTTTESMWFNVWMCLDGYDYDDSGLFYLTNDIYTRLI